MNKIKEILETEIDPVKLAEAPFRIAGMPLRLANAGLRLQQRRLRRLLRGRSGKKPGLPPGTLVYTGETPGEAATARLHVFDEDTLEAFENADIDLIRAQRAEGRVWIDVEGVHDLDLLRALGQEFGLHELTLEDVARTGQRPKLEAYEGYLFVVVRMLRHIDEEGRVDFEQVSLILGPDFVISFQERPGDVFDPVRQRLMNPQSRIRTDSLDYLLYRIMDVVVDNYFVVLEKLGDAVEHLDGLVMSAHGNEGLSAIHALKQESLLLRRSVWPLREVLTQLQRDELPMITPATRVYMRDVYDHTVEVIETIETIRDLISGMMDLHLTMVSNRMNEVMKVLTVIATIFVPLTFIVGIYGMNFDYMPELAVRWAYPAVWVVMIAVALGMVAFFRRRGWF